jgi:hypothetical protein
LFQSNQNKKLDLFIKKTETLINARKNTYKRPLKAEITTTTTNTIDPSDENSYESPIISLLDLQTG